MTDPESENVDPRDAVDATAAEPDAAEPDAAEPDAAEPDAAEPDAAGPVTARRSARGAILVSARIVTGTIAVGVAALAIGAAAWLPFPAHQTTPRSAIVTPEPAAQKRVCAGPLLRLGDDSGQAATTISSIGRASVVYNQTVGNATETELSSTDNSSGLAPKLLTLPSTSGTSSTRPLLAGSQSQQANTGDFVGLAAAECSEGSSDSWLVGGATNTGRTTLVTLSNPSTVIATVTLGIYSETGAVSAAGTDGIVVPPGGQRVLSLAGFAPNVTSSVIRVQSRGGQVIAHLQQSTVRTLEPGGVDIVGAGAEPSTRAVIPGFVIANEAATVARQPEPGFSDLSSVIRLFVPGEAPARAEITIVPEDGSAPGAPVSVVIKPGMVTDLPLDEYPDGSYTVTVTSDKPLVAGARVSTVGTTGQSDFAWLAAAATVSGQALVTVAPGPAPVLHIANPTRTDDTVTLHEEGQADITITIPAGRTIQHSVTAGASYTLSGFDRAELAVSYLGDGRLAAFTVSPSAPASRPITIYP